MLHSHYKLYSSIKQAHDTHKIRTIIMSIKNQHALKQTNLPPP